MKDPIIKLGPGGDYRRPWPDDVDEDVDNAATVSWSCVALAVVVVALAGLALMLLEWL